MSSEKNIFLCPLDWGLGHATRCIPIVTELMNQGADVTLGAEGSQAVLLREALPDTRIIDFPGYHMNYPARGSMAWTMLKQLPQMAAAVKAERRLLAELVNSNGFDAVISDNRFGLYHPDVYSIYITHQVQIIPPENHPWLGPLLRSAHRRYINHFDELWIPDLAGDYNLSGALSHVNNLPHNSHYIGPLSRIKPGIDREKDVDLLVLLSGLEPQRTVLENIIIAQLPEFSGKVVIIRGLPGGGADVKVPGHVNLYTHLTGEEIASYLERSKIVLCRPGYSTIMELAFFGCKAVVVPTPGQTEQEYLAGYHSAAGHYVEASQDELDLTDASAKAREADGVSLDKKSDNLRKRIEAILSLI